MAMQLGRGIRRICESSARSFTSGPLFPGEVGVGMGEVISGSVLVAWFGYWFDSNGWRTKRKTEADALHRRYLESVIADLEAMRRAVKEDNGSKEAVNAKLARG